MLIYREAGIFHITNAIVSQALIRGKTTNGTGTAAQEFVELIVNIVGEEELIDTVTWPSPEPALVTTLASLPYAFWETDLELNSTAIPMESFSFLINNNLIIKTFNERFPTCIRSAGRDVKLDVESPFTCDTLDESIALNEAAGTGQLTFATTGMSTVFDFAAIWNNFETPTVPGKSDIPLKYELEAFETSSVKEVVITHDATP